MIGSGLGVYLDPADNSLESSLRKMIFRENHPVKGWLSVKINSFILHKHLNKYTPLYGPCHYIFSHHQQSGFALNRSLPLASLERILKSGEKLTTPFGRYPPPPILAIQEDHFLGSVQNHPAVMAGRQVLLGILL